MNFTPAPGRYPRNTQHAQTYPAQTYPARSPPHENQGSHPCERNYSVAEVHRMGAVLGHLARFDRTNTIFCI